MKKERDPPGLNLTPEHWVRSKRWVLPAPRAGVPMTYEIDGRQFIVLAIGARGAPGELVALTVP